MSYITANLRLKKQKGRFVNMAYNATIHNNTHGFLVPKGFSFTETFRDELDGMEVRFTRIGTPGAHGTTFAVPGENPGETEEVPEFTGVILWHHPINFYFPEPYRGKKAEPACRSYDGVTGTGNPGGSCRDCPLNLYGSGENGGKACRNKRRVYLLREGEAMPVFLSVPTGSLKPFCDYVTWLVGKGVRPSAVATRFYIEKVKSENGRTAFSQIQFGFERKLSGEEFRYVRDLAAMVREYGKRRVIDEFAEQVDPETGEVLIHNS